MPPIRLGFFTTTDSIINRRLFTGLINFAREHPPMQLAHWKTSFRGDSKIFRSLDLDGIFVPNTAVHTQLGSPDLPTIILSSRDRASPLPRVCDDQIWIGRIAARHLLGRGLKHFAFCGFRFHHGSRDRLTGFEAELKKAGRRAARFEFSSSTNQDLAINSPAEQRRLRHWLNQLPTPCAVMAFCDAIAIVIMESCVAVGRSIPSQFSLLSVDNDPFLINSFPLALSSIDPGSAATGYEAAKAMMRWVREGIRPEKETRVARATLRARQTTGRYHVDDELVSKLVDLIDERIRSPISVSKLAATLGCSRRTLERRVRESAGISIHQAITNERLERVKQALTESDLPVKAIAAEFGFSSPQQLGAIFRKHLAITPAKWRQRQPLE